MSSFGFDFTSAVFVIGNLVVVAGVTAVLVILCRLMLAATRAANALTAERTLHVDLLLEEGDPDSPTPPPSAGTP
jgi:hypothetical protein